MSSSSKKSSKNIKEFAFLTASTVVIGVLEMTLKLVVVLVLYQELLSCLALSMTLPKSCEKARLREGAPAKS